MGSATLEGFIDPHFIAADSKLGNYSGARSRGAPAATAVIGRWHAGLSALFSAKSRIDLGSFVQPEQP
jgi:hypothetical protein